MTVGGGARGVASHAKSGRARMWDTAPVMAASASRPPALFVPMRRAAVLGYLVAAVALPVVAAIGWLVAGSAGLWGAVVGLSIPVAFLSVTVLLALATARLAPTALGAVVLGSWLVKVVVLIAVLALIADGEWYSRGVLFAVFLVSVLAYLVLEALVVVRTRVPYVDPAPTGDGDGRL